MARPATIRLNCIISGDDAENTFVVTLPSDSTVTDLVVSIGDTHKRFTGEDLTGIRLIQCSLTKDQLSKLESLTNEPPLSRMGYIEDYWPDFSTIDRKMVHVLVYAANRSRVVPETPQISPDAGITDTISQLTLAQEKTQRKIQDGLSASTAALPRIFMAEQKRDDTPIYNGRPWDRTGKPIEIYHSAFRVFLDNLNQEDIASELDYTSTENLLWDSQAIYKDKGKRGIAITTQLSTLLRRDISYERVSGCQADGVIKWRALNNGLQAYYSILDIKNEIGDATCDPSIQGAQSYAKYWSQDEVNPIRKLSCCPSFILAIAGPWICILGGIYLTEIVVQPLTEMLWMANHPHKESRLRYLSRVFAALRDGIDHLDAYYRSLVSNISPATPLREDLARFYPDICQYQANGHETKIIYVDDINRLVFKAQTEDGRYVVVKFVERYNAPAHELLALHGLAPKLLFDSADRLYGGYRMVVMELIDGKPLSEHAEITVGPQAATEMLRRVCPSVEQALKLLHGDNFAFGDLRPPNIMVVEENGETKAKLVDFDWCVVAGEGRYPVNLSEQIMWPEGVARGGFIQKEHDNAMFDSIFP
ncbi:hypothetical protein RSOLAG22IIIB_09424 [Rhizoctonia solani]|uniref:Protein kinase domain-containing protein n=1 Tax=Rhizoctonia solani TaxID=456999 RepID=A0A0K6FYC0_9AGAM|nr:hypothetical protein RSOLAG22IIIB_09424 [Rhizoctonia solani]